MSTQQIAQFMIERRSRSMPIVTSGEVLGAIGSDGLQEALTRRWIVPSPDTGLLQINTDLARVSEMVMAAGVTESAPQIVENASTVFATAHAQRPLMEIAAPGTGKPGPALSSAPAPSTPTAPVAPAAPTSSAPKSVPSADLGVGTDVTIAEEGKTYTGKVAGRSADGRYRVSFGAAGKPPVNREYTSDEMQVR